jgi:hypothetical protein
VFRCNSWPVYGPLFSFLNKKDNDEPGQCDALHHDHAAGDERAAKPVLYLEKQAYHRAGYAEDNQYDGGAEVEKHFAEIDSEDRQSKTGLYLFHIIHSSNLHFFAILARL